MKIAIIGAGAMGSLFGGLLSKGKADVRLLDVWPEHVQAVNKNGQILDLDVTRNLCRTAVEEAAAVAKTLGILVRNDIIEHVYHIAGATAGNRSSMGQDVDHHRLTEISAINGAVVSEARKAGISVPVNQTLTALVETLQAHYA